MGDDDTTLSFELGVETEEFDVPGRGGRSVKEAAFNWLLQTDRLWMVSSRYAGDLEKVTGVDLLFKLANLKINWQSKNSELHPALKVPKTDRGRRRAFEEFERFFKTLPASEKH